MLGRLLLLRPDLTLDQQNGQPGQGQPAQALPLNNISTSTPAVSETWPGAHGNAVAPSANANAGPLQLAHASPIRIRSPDALSVQPQFDPPPAYRPFLANDPPSPGGFSRAGALLGLGLGALILNNAKKTEEPNNEEETVGQPADRPPTGSLPIDQTPWSGDHTEIKRAIESQAGRSCKYISEGLRLGTKSGWKLDQSWDLMESGGDASVNIDLQGDTNIGDSLPWREVVRLGALRIELGIEVFPEFN